MRYSISTSQDPSAANMMWQVIKNFNIQWKAIKTKAKDDPPSVPKLGKNVEPANWLDSWNQYISNVYGQRNCTLEYVDREKADVPPAAPTLLAGQPHSEEAGSVSGELVRRLSHNHALY